MSARNRSAGVRKYLVAGVTALVLVPLPARADSIYRPPFATPRHAIFCRAHSPLPTAGRAACDPHVEVHAVSGRVVSSAFVSSDGEGTRPSEPVSAESWGWFEFPYTPTPGTTRVTVTAQFRVDRLTRNAHADVGSSTTHAALAVLQYQFEDPMFRYIGGASRELGSEGEIVELSFSVEVRPHHSKRVFRAYLRNEVSLRGRQFATPYVPRCPVSQMPICTPYVPRESIEAPAIGRVSQRVDAAVDWVSIAEEP